MSGSWTDSPEDVELLVERKALTSEVEQLLHSLDESILVNSSAWNRAYAEKVSGAMVAIHAPFTAGSKVAMELITDMLNNLELLREQLTARDKQIKATESESHKQPPPQLKLRRQGRWRCTAGRCAPSGRRSYGRYEGSL